MAKRDPYDVLVQRVALNAYNVERASLKLPPITGFAGFSEAGRNRRLAAARAALDTLTIADLTMLAERIEAAALSAAVGEGAIDG